jgi:single-strand DNA-binding protein
MNKCVFIGRLTRNPELRYSQAGKAFATFTLAVDRKMWSKKNDGQQQADFIPCIAWDKLAEIIGNNLAKGRRVGVEGRLQTRTYEAQDGSKRSAFDVVLDELEFLDPKQQGQQSQGQSQPQQAYQPAVTDEEIPF